ncbi:MAG: sporulation protein YabP [Eubacteriales bacterium]|nr:sporulation protein YabP [Eubacteriales bacterium]
MERSTAEKQSLPHGISLQDRKKLSVSGVSDVANFDENQIIIVTQQGTLFVRGGDLHVDQLNLDAGELRISGRIDCMEYDDGGAAGGFLRRLFQ